MHTPHAADPFSLLLKLSILYCHCTFDISLVGAILRKREINRISKGNDTLEINGSRNGHSRVKIVCQQFLRWKNLNFKYNFVSKE